MDKNCLLSMAKVVESSMLYVSPDKAIELRGFDYDTGTILEIDERLGPFSSDATVKYSNVRDPLREFWNRTETVCVAGCCGVGAFGIEPEEILDVVKELDSRTLLDQLERIREQVLRSDATIISYHRLNYNFERNSFLELLDYLIGQIKQWL